MNRTIKNICIFMCMVLILSVFTPVFAAEQDTTSSEISIKDEKIYANATIDQDFVDNHVLVVMDRSVSAINKTHNFSSARSVSISNVTDLTQIDLPQPQTETTASVFSTEKLDTEQNVPLVNMDSFRQILLLELPTHSKENVLATIKVLESVEGIRYAGPDYITYPTATTPNDDYCNSQWAIEKIQLNEAWDISTGSTAIRVGVIDSGIASHPDLNANIVEGWDFYNENAITTDDVKGHGTHVAGIIGAVSNNSGGIAGASWNVNLVPLQVTKNAEGQSSTSISILAITYCISNNIPIINYSRSSDNVDTALEQAIANYQGLFICSASNQGRDIDTEPRYPASYKLNNTICVANTTRNDTLSSGSNYGKNIVHLAAPGTSILSCFPSEICEQGCNPLDHGTHYEDGYHYMTGTSMATPYVTGVAALIKSCRPYLSAEEIKELILDNVDVVDALEGKCITGGRLNAYKAVLAATEPPTLTGDVNGDGRDDVILSRGVNGNRAITVYLGQSNGKFSEPITSQTVNQFYYNTPTFVGDFNGDGCTDVLIHWENNGRRQLLVYISQGDGTFYAGANLASSRNHNDNSLPCTFCVADVNGDGKDDFVVNYRNTSGYRYALVYKGKATGPFLVDATTDALVTSDLYYSNEPVYTGDFNGDGRADLVVHQTTDDDNINNVKRVLRVYTGTSSGTFNAGVNLTSTRGHNPADYPTKNFVTDVDGDGKDDFVVHWKNHSSDRSNLVYKGKSASPYLIDATTDALSSTNNYIETDPVYVADVNGDGRSDMVVHWVNNSGYRQLLIYIANSDGTYNDAIRHTTTNPHNSALYSETMVVADINGDGRDDFVVKRRNERDSVQFMTYLGRTTGEFSPAATTTPTTFIPYFDALPSLQAGNYKITNIGANKCLNIYGNNVTTLNNNQNVTLWSDSGTNEQKWYITSVGSSAYVKSVIDLSFGLNVYRSGDPWNCDVYPISGNETDALVDFIQTSSGFKIKLHNYDLYLTAASSSDGANVYWDSESTSSYQLWDLTPQ